MAASVKWHRDQEFDEFNEIEYGKQRRQQRLKNKRRDKRKLEEPMFDDRFEDEAELDYNEDEG